MYAPAPLSISSMIAAQADEAIFIGSRLGAPSGDGEEGVAA